MQEARGSMKHKAGHGVCPWSLNNQRLKRGCHGFRVNLWYMVNFKLTWTTKWDYVLNNINSQNNKKETRLKESEGQTTAAWGRSKDKRTLGRVGGSVSGERFEIVLPDHSTKPKLSCHQWPHVKTPHGCFWGLSFPSFLTASYTLHKYPHKIPFLASDTTPPWFFILHLELLFPWFLLLFQTVRIVVS